MKLKYLMFYIVWIAEFYILFSIENRFKPISGWDLMSVMHFNFYGVLVGFVFVVFWYVNDNFNPDKR